MIAATLVTERTLTLTRVLNAPRTLVFKTWTDPLHFAQWWGPTGFTNPVCELDLRVHGEIRIDMRAPDGAIFPMAGAFREIVEPERLVFTSAALNQNGKPYFENLNSITFDEFEGNRTLITVHVQVLWSSPEAEQALGGMSMGWSMTLDRLNDFITDPGAAAGREITANRLYKAPRELVWRMFTEPEHITHWWGPNGFTTTIHQMNVRPGGEWRLTLHGPDGTDYPNHKIYEEVLAPARLVIRHIAWPPHRMYVVFSDAEEGTLVSIRMLFDLSEDRDKVVTQVGADKKLIENLEKLDTYLNNL
ncbi:MAG TPA: SRPBCC domain-containing protein [Acidobacteriaceae bacterium]|nr:SRPBCC domain-containing protein [Acidobacteriaceae bacterium]